MAIVELTPDESILRIVHRHFYSFVDDAFSILLFFALPFVFAIIMIFFVPSSTLDTIFQGNANIGIIYIALTGILFAWMYGWWRWTDHFLNVIVITNERIYEIKQRGFFRREVGSFGLDRIQNITTTQKGIIATAFNFGDLYIETAGENENLNMLTVPNPSELKQFINELQDHFKATRRQ
jgi:membrane protein YdbS with pleckstrin-like domain